MHSKRKRAYSIEATTDLIDWIKSNAKKVHDSSNDLYVAEIYVGFAVGKSNFITENDYFARDGEDDRISVMVSPMTQVGLIDSPAQEFNKKVASKVTKAFPLQLKDLFARLYSELSSPFYYGFTYEIERAAFQLIQSESSTLLTADASDLLNYPPNEFLLKNVRQQQELVKD